MAQEAQPFPKAIPRRTVATNFGLAPLYIIPGSATERTFGPQICAHFADGLDNASTAVVSANTRGEERKTFLGKECGTNF